MNEFERILASREQRLRDINELALVFFVGFPLGLLIALVWVLL